MTAQGYSKNFRTTKTFTDVPEGQFQGERGSLTVRYGFREGLTPYARLGDLPVLFAALLLLGSPLLSRRR